MAKRVKRIKQWAAEKTAEATVPLPPTEAEKLALYDALVASFRVTAAGVDVTSWAPQLPPELRKPK